MPRYEQFEHEEPKPVYIPGRGEASYPGSPDGGDGDDEDKKDKTKTKDGHTIH